MSRNRLTRRFGRAVAAVFCCLALPTSTMASPSRPILVLQPSTPEAEPVSLVFENFDLVRFGDPENEAGLKRHFQTKYRDKIGVDGEEIAHLNLRAGITEIKAAPQNLPADGEVLFKPPFLREASRNQILVIAALFVLQTGLIAGFFFEHRRRRLAETESRERMSETALMNRRSTAGELSTSIAHELAQPLSAIRSNAEAAELILNSTFPDLKEVKAIVGDIKKDDERATLIIQRIRKLLSRAHVEVKEIDINDAVEEVLSLVSDKAIERGAPVANQLLPDLPKVDGDRIQIQQVVLNLVVNALDAVATRTEGRREVSCSSDLLPDGYVRVSIIELGTRNTDGQAGRNFRGVLYYQRSWHGDGTCDFSQDYRGPSRPHLGKKPVQWWCGVPL